MRWDPIEIEPKRVYIIEVEYRLSIEERNFLENQFEKVGAKVVILDNGIRLVR